MFKEREVSSRPEILPVGEVVKEQITELYKKMHKKMRKSYFITKIFIWIRRTFPAMVASRIYGRRDEDGKYYRVTPEIEYQWRFLYGDFIRERREKLHFYSPARE
jgi:hypothetical protein